MYILSNECLINLDDVSVIYVKKRRNGRDRLIARMKDGSEYVLKAPNNKNFNLYHYLRDISASESEGFEIYNISDSELP